MQNAHRVIGDSDEEEALDKKRSELHLLPGDDCGHGGRLGGQRGGHSSEGCGGAICGLVVIGREGDNIREVSRLFKQ